MHSNSSSCCTANQAHRLIRYVKGVLVCFLIASTAACCISCQRESVAPHDDRPIQVQIDFNGRADNKQFQVEWQVGETAFSCLKRLESQGRLKVESTGSGSQTLLTAIDGLENLKAAGDNWIYTVNDKLGDRSSAVFDLNPGDRLVWRFGKYSVQ